MTITVSANYCASSPHKQSLVARGFTLQDNGPDCRFELTLETPTTESKTAITDNRVILNSLLPFAQTDVDAGLLSVDTGNTSVGGASLTNCALVNPVDDYSTQVACDVSLADTNRGKKLTIVAKKTLDGRQLSQSISYDQYLIDAQAPLLANDVRLDMTAPRTVDQPSFVLRTLPRDIGGAGGVSCQAVYVDVNSAEQHIDLAV